MNSIRSHFPILHKPVAGKSLVYLDNASTTHKPQQVIDAVSDFYATHNANVHRGVYALAEQATHRYESARARVAQFIGAHDPSEIVFTHGTTESINLVASTWAHEHLREGDEIIITELEHHANMLPWQRVAQQKGAVLHYIPVHFDGTLDLGALDALLSERTKLIALSHVSHFLGIEIDINTIVKKAKTVGARVLIDAAQSVPHQRIDVAALDVDFLVFSGHKIMGPTGVGVLYVNKKLHNQMPPYQLGGGMVAHVGFYDASFKSMPHRLEAGTPPVAQVVGLAAALDFFDQQIDPQKVRNHETALTAYVIEQLSESDRISILGPVEQLKQEAHLFSFVVDGMHPHDIAAHLSKEGICVRAGHHCAQPLAKKMGLHAALRVSFYAYNTRQEAELLVSMIKQIL